MDALFPDEYSISIHAPRTGSDRSTRRLLISSSHFNPRSPHGERLLRFFANFLRNEFQSTLPARGATCVAGKENFCKEFQSTLPARGATERMRLQRGWGDISIHAPRTGSDSKKPPTGKQSKNFNPRSPHGERRTSTTNCKWRSHFNPRSPHGERQTQEFTSK